MLIRLLIVLAFVFVPSKAVAQIVTADALIYNTGSCVWQSGTGSPEDVVTANVCAYWIQTDAPYHLWRKVSGSGNTGWMIVNLPAAASGRILFSTASNVWGDSANFTFDGTRFGLTGYMDFADMTAPASPSASTSRLWSETLSGFSQLHFKGSNGIDYEIGRDLIHTVSNTTGATIPKGSWVYISGSTGTVPNVALAQANSLNTAPVAGIVVADIANNAFGQMMTEGDVQSINTSAFSAGDILYLSSTVAGGVTTTIPTGTDIYQRVGVVVRANAGNGIIAVLISGEVDPGLEQTFSRKTFSTNILFTPDNTVDVGATGARPRSGIFGTSVTTPVVYGSGSPVQLGLGGAGGANEYASHLLTSVAVEQRLATNPIYRSRWNVNEDRTSISAFAAGSWTPLLLEGGPVQVRGNGLHLGGTGSVSAPGVGNTFVEGWMRSVNPAYASRTSGMSVDFSDGSIDGQYATFEEMHVTRFIADLEMALAGMQVITKSVAVLDMDFTVPAPGSIATLHVRDLPSAAGMQVFEVGDTVRLRQFSRAGGTLSVTDAYGTVSSPVDLTDGTQTWAFTRALSPCSGAMVAGTIVEAESLVLDYGVSGNGYIESSAVDGLYGVNSPYVQTATWNTCANDVTVRTRLGNLKGIGPGTWGYGLFAGNYASGRYAVFSDQTVELHNVPFTMYNGVTPVIDLSPTVPSFAMGVDSSVVSATAGSGMWSGLSGGCFLWRVGDPAAQGINYNSCSGTLTVTGDIIVSGTVPDADNALALGGIPAATYEGVKDKVDAGLTATGNPALPAVATPSGSGLYMGSDYMGYYASGAWRTFMQSNGNFYLGGTGGALQWVAATNTLTIAANLSGNGSGITSITGGNITTGSVTATQIAAATITATQIAAGTITASNIATGTITATQMAANSITATQIAAGSITTAKIAAGAITANEIAAGTVTAEKIATGTITATQIAGATITASNIAAGTITGTQIASNTITTSNLNFTVVGSTNVIAMINASAEGIAITADRVAISGATTFSAGYDPSAKIASGGAAADINANVTTITGGKITTGSITADKLDVTTLSAVTTNTGSLTVQDTITINSSGSINGSGYELSGDYGLGFQNASDNNDYQHIVWWQSGGAIGSNNTRTHVWGPSGTMAVSIYGAAIDFQGSGPTSIMSVNDTGEVWVGDFAVGTQGRLFLPDVTSATSQSYPLIMGAGYEVMQKTNGLNGWAGCSYVGDIYADHGIVTSVSCATPASLGLATRSEVDVLRDEIAELRALVFSLTGGRK